MIYSISQHKEIPIIVTKDTQYIDNILYNKVTRYTVSELSNQSNDIGFVELEDTKNGVKVVYIANQQPELYKHFGQVADRIEVEHCLGRGIENPYIQSVAAINTHIKHFKRGKRFVNEGINIYFDSLIKKLKIGEHVMLGFLGYQKMYMPMNLINEIKAKIKINPLLKG